MTTAKSLILSLFVLASAAFTTKSQENVDFTCMKAHKASNTCHFNFKVDGEKYRYVDIGCKYSKKQNEVIQKAKEGTLPLAKDWKFACAEPKAQKESDKATSGF
jgi:hypothetical protein